MTDNLQLNENLTSVSRSVWMAAVELTFSQKEKKGVIEQLCMHFIGFDLYLLSLFVPLFCFYIILVPFKL